MSFSNACRAYLHQMGIDADLYHADLISRFNNGAKLIDSLITNFGVKSNSSSSEAFNLHMKQCGISDESNIFNHAYDIFNYIRMFREGGRFGLFKGRQAEWEGPIVTLCSGDVPQSDVNALNDGMKIFRGMSVDEFNSGQFGQSWTANFDVANRFAKETYSDMSQGIVAITSLVKNNAIYHSMADPELEVIMAPHSVASANRIET